MGMKEITKSSSALQQTLFETRTGTKSGKPFKNSMPSPLAKWCQCAPSRLLQTTSLYYRWHGCGVFHRLFRLQFDWLLTDQDIQAIDALLVESRTAKLKWE
jgi:hypothetical protein